MVNQSLSDIIVADNLSQKIDYFRLYEMAELMPGRSSLHHTKAYQNPARS